MRAEPAERGGRWSELFTLELGRRRGLAARIVTDVTRELATMLGAGQDLDRALRFIVETAPQPARAPPSWHRMRDKVRGGSSLAAALAQAAAELSQAVYRPGPRRRGRRRAGRHAGPPRGPAGTRAQPGRDRAVGAGLPGPAAGRRDRLDHVLLLAMCCRSSCRCSSETGAELPTMTKLLIAFGERHAGSPGRGCCCWLARPGLGPAPGAEERAASARPVDRLLLRLPIVGSLLRESLAARFTRTLGTLLQERRAADRARLRIVTRDARQPRRRRRRSRSRARAPRAAPAWRGR